jgi:hypothetical protein
VNGAQVVGHPSATTTEAPVAGSKKIRAATPIALAALVTVFPKQSVVGLKTGR